MTTAVKSKPKTSMPGKRSEEAQAERPIWEIVAEIGAQISDDEWEKVPDDASINYRQHLYGAPEERA